LINRSDRRRAVMADSLPSAPWAGTAPQAPPTNLDAMFSWMHVLRCGD
jgi:hypothetical protein